MFCFPLSNLCYIMNVFFIFCLQYGLGTKEDNVSAHSGYLFFLFEYCTCSDSCSVE
ncbi:unnamed protein product [Spirodela intermedia]|uniref:Uncharacterized protein n=2 Tax=Spirodela intermedia TaxID=51605 RepID=A0A7I8KK63_SPIIN|nr:unnamed protein product [Spirodela intermedia]CAA6661471.1 unnamed protein product [Spirodela intermedia]CAA7397832.1 unnamed protein product [Spirodela intermedia]